MPIEEGKNKQIEVIPPQDIPALQHSFILS